MLCNWFVIPHCNIYGFILSYMALSFHVWCVLDVTMLVCIA